jgi:hypothetical protein
MLAVRAWFSHEEWNNVLATPYQESQEEALSPLPQMQQANPFAPAPLPDLPSGSTKGLSIQRVAFLRHGVRSEIITASTFRRIFKGFLHGDP